MAKKRKDELDLVFISAGYVEDASIAHLVFGLDTPEPLTGKEIAKKFVDDVKRIYLDEDGEKIKECCLKAQTDKKKFCPDCGTRIEGSCGIETERFDFEEFIHDQIRTNTDGSSHMWWEKSLTEYGWYIWTHDVDVVTIRRIVSISCIEAAVDPKDVRLSVQITKVK